MNLTPATVLAGALLLAALWLGWLWLVTWRYRVRAAAAERLWAVAEDGWRIAVYYRPASIRRFREPVLLCHGFAINRHTFDFDPPYSLAHALSEAGFDCFTVEWRGTGASWRPPRGLFRSFTVDDHIRLDAPALIRLALERTGAERVFWVGHSLGGMVGYAAAQGPEGTRLRGLVALGSPVFYRYQTWVRRAMQVGAVAAWPYGLRYRFLGLTVAPFLGYLRLPLADLIINPAHVAPAMQRRVVVRAMSSIGRRVLLQLRDWVVNDAFRSVDGSVDYREGIRRLRLPLLVSGGSQDRLAPPPVLQAQYDLAGSEDKTLVIFGRDRGDREDYGHADLVYGQGAPAEVYPLIRRWLEEHATRSAPPGPAA
ncbi:MAG TPA: alpha/beta fold hydrolase [Myxococcales bacterium]|nr:alpha/beta fold hydrolase [Myxococcales bacterium]